MCILINNTYYSFIFNMSEKLKIKLKYGLVDKFSTDEIEIINEYREKVLEQMRYYDNGTYYNMFN